MGFVYVIRNNCNIKVYVGQTKKSIEERMKKHCSSAKTYKNYLEHPENYPHWKGTCTKLYNAMNKHGIDNFHIEQLEEIHNELLDDLECLFIEEFDSIRNGYNLKEGGNRHDHSEETKKFISERTREGVIRNIDNHRTYDIVKGLPPYCIRVNIKGSEGVAVNNHPKCKRKSFTVRKYGSLEKATEELLKFYNTLDTAYVIEKAGNDLPKGLRKIKNGYAVQKIINGQLHYKAFTKYSAENNLKYATEYLNTLTS